MNSEITVECKICGDPVNLVYERTSNEAIDTALMSMAKMVVHDRCREYAERRQVIATEEQRVLKRAADWKILCPALYQNSDEWLRSAEAGRKVRMIAVNKVLAWNYGERGLLAHGRKSGTGKTTAAWVLVKREFRQGKFIVATSHTALSEKATLIAKGETDNKWVSLLKRCDLLFVDDLGKSRFKGVSGEGRASEEFLFELVDHRIGEKLPTIFTCNMAGDELVKAMSSERGEAFVRRLKEFFISVNFDQVRAVETWQHQQELRNPNND